MELTECFETSTYKILTRIIYISYLHCLWRWNWQCSETSAYKILTYILLIPRMKMELTEYSETSAYKILIYIHPYIAYEDGTEYSETST